MNDTIKVINSRRSVRKYKTTPIADAEIKTIAEAAIYAPSAMNQQKWHFTVVRSPEMIAKMNNAIRENLLNSGVEFLAERAKNPDFDVFHGAPALIMVTAEEDARFTEIDCGAAAENIALAAESLNIGSCFIGMAEFLFASDDASKIKQEMGIPENYRHIITVVLGYKDVEPPVPPKNIDAINYI
ncbi:MAG: nitroreductase family protein [Dehalococcoidales bacterium]|nr:nitroreductase family protein [Dehalococcoidales bacterium]